MRSKIGHWLRKWADRIDHRGAPKAIGWSFTHEHMEGRPRFRDDGRGCPLWYLGDDAYARAHSEADTEHVIVNWKDGTARFGR